MLWTILLLIFTVYIIYRFLTFSGKYTLPPGPPRWPLVGNAINVNTSQGDAFADLSKKYGGIVSLNFFGRKVVLLSDVSIIKEASNSLQLAENLYTYRPPSFVSRTTVVGRTTPYLEPTENWLSRRQILCKKINIYTDGLQLSESALKQELNRVTEWIASHKEKPVDLAPVLLASLVNTSTILLLGKRFPHEGQEIKAVCDLLIDLERLSDERVDALLSALPCLSRIPLLHGASYKSVTRNLKLLQDYYFSDPKNNYKPGTARGLMDLLLKVKAEGNNNDSSVTEFSEDDVMQMVVGVFTTSVPKIHAALMNFIWITLHKPAVALRIQREVEKVTGSSRLPTLRDRERMPYTQAAILELLRYCSPVALTKHRVSSDTKLADFLLPTNTTVLTDLWSVHHDESLWEDPLKFKPERFLDVSGKLIPESATPRKHLMAFGIGKRKCVGQNFAMSRMFLYVTALLQQFNFRSAEGETTPPTDNAFVLCGNILKPAPFKVKVFHHLYKVDFYRHEKS